MEEEATLGELLEAVASSLDAMRSAMAEFAAHVRRLERRIKTLERPGVGLVLRSRRIVGRKRGRPPGTPNRNKHVVIN